MRKFSSQIILAEPGGVALPPTIGAAKAMLPAVKQDKKGTKAIEAYLMPIAARLAKHIHIDEYRRSRMHSVLQAGGINLSPELYQAYALVRAGAVLLAAIPCALLFPPALPVFVIVAVLVYYKQSQKADACAKVRPHNCVFGAFLKIYTYFCFNFLEYTKYSCKIAPQYGANF